MPRTVGLAAERPGCRVGGQGRGHVPPQCELPYRYEQLVEPAHWYREDGRRKFSAAAVARQPSARQFFSHPRFGFGPDDRAVATILERMGGLRQEPSASEAGGHRRWAPTAGNLGSVQIYVALPAAGGRPAGVFLYDWLEHELTLVSDRASVRAVAAVTEPQSTGDARMILILTAVLPKLVRKYGDLGFRLAHLDAGCAVSQGRAVARRFALDLELATRWDDLSLLGLLDLDRDREPITAVGAVHGR
jgi:SagB-type dehydrogenase family enzyme